MIINLVYKVPVDVNYYAITGGSLEAAFMPYNLKAFISLRFKGVIWC